MTALKEVRLKIRWIYINENAYAIETSKDDLLTSYRERREIDIQHNMHSINSSISNRIIKYNIITITIVIQCDKTKVKDMY